jgi:hypothetical protein
MLILNTYHVDILFKLNTYLYIFTSALADVAKYQQLNQTRTSNGSLEHIKQRLQNCKCRVLYCSFLLSQYIHIPYLDLSILLVFLKLRKKKLLLRHNVNIKHRKPAACKPNDKVCVPSPKANPRCNSKVYTGCGC